MRIGFYAPFKPLGHQNPSGDLIIATGLVNDLVSKGHHIKIMSRLRSRWIFWKPWNMIRALGEKIRIKNNLARQGIDLWLTYHSYYKAPDLLGPTICRQLGIPYVIFQGIYATRVRKSWQTRPGYRLNTKALLTADMVLTNRRDDLLNLQRLLPDDRLSYLAPGIYPAQFAHDPAARITMRSQWNAGDLPVILSAAMFRADVKTAGLIRVIESCARLLSRGIDLRLVIAGDGREKQRLVSLAGKLLGDKAVFAGKIPREKMFKLYSGADLFVFPGINESLGMVYLEAQSCGLPVVAFDNGGIPEVVRHGETGLLTPLFDTDRFDEAVALLLTDEKKRRMMGKQAADFIRDHHDLGKNYLRLEQILEQVITCYQKKIQRS
ncbi:MAG: glycosyltransferase family 4 protein [Desulfobulbaceae bacterium]|nr:glycosyltransferase family 4 protein [Desulfobulbaceae bacterium]